MSQTFITLILREIDTLLKYFPNDLLTGSNQMKNDVSYEDLEMKENKKVIFTNLDEFFNVISDTIAKNLSTVDDERFLSLWKGILNSKFSDVNLIGTFLSNFDLRISKSEKSKEFYLEFLQNLAYHAKDNKPQSIDFDLVYKSVYDSFIKRHLHSFNIKEFATILWILYHFKILNKEKIVLMEEPIKEILLSYINDPKNMSSTKIYETRSYVFDNYQIEPYDVKAIQFFINSIEAYKGPLNDVINTTLKCMQHENSKGWFN